MTSLQVNSDVVFYTRNQNGTLNPYMVDKTYVGKCILTESVEEGQVGWTDITHNYKYPEGDTHAHKHTCRCILKGAGGVSCTKSGHQGATKINSAAIIL